MRFGEYIHTIRIQRGLRLAGLSQKTGLSRSYLSQLEAGLKTRPSDRVIKALSGALDLDAAKVKELAEEEASRDKLQDLRVLVASAIHEFEELQDALDAVNGYYNEDEDGERHSKATSDSAGDVGVELDVATLANIAGDDGRPKTPVDSMDQDYLRAVMKVHVVTSRLQGRLNSILEHLDERLSRPRFSREVEEIAVQVESLGDTGIWFIREQLKIVSRLLKQGSSCAEERTGGMGNDRAHQETVKALLDNRPNGRTQSGPGDWQEQTGSEVGDSEGHEEGGRGSDDGAPPPA